jgi:hypothetical protein
MIAAARQVAPADPDARAACSVARQLRIVPAGREAFDRLACFHYRDERISVYARIFALVAGDTGSIAGVIVYTMPPLGLELRTAALPGMFDGLSRREKCRILNRDVRRIARVIIEPRYRGIGLAQRLVRESLPLAGVPVVEALAAMGEVNPFFEKAGMKRIDGCTSARCTRLLNALALVSIPGRLFIDPRAVHRRLDGLAGERRLFMEAELGQFLKAYGRRRNMQHSFDRTRFVLSRLCIRPVYYVWMKPGAAGSDSRQAPFRRGGCDRKMTSGEIK